ncbi:hypothetical protein [Amedibacillus dolichus]|uniref:hypothetical protein n=1 Tax=Amedibacillus dolichus TaxID=31971 RepID=UPI00241C7721|nr:hypothetical protein [Amedibacillus dolichus]
MKINYKSILITVLLLIVLGVVLFVETGMFISGPQRKYEDDIRKIETTIMKNYRGIKNIQRHVFYYTVYVGENDKNIVWFNELGEDIVTRKLKTKDFEKVERSVEERYHAKHIEVSLGYGYDNPVYVVECDKGLILLDYDTLKEVYYLKDGDV